MLERMLVAAALLVAASPQAAAQVDAAVSLGLSFSYVDPADSRAESYTAPGLLLRLRGDEGLNTAIGFNWFSTNVSTTVGGQDVRLGRLDVKPLMVGVSLGRQYGRVMPEVMLEAGYAFNRLRPASRAKAAYAAAGAGEAAFHADDCFAWRGIAGVWLDMGRRVGLRLSVGYLGVRPAVTATTSAGSRRETYDLGSVVTTVGLVYTIF